MRSTKPRRDLEVVTVQYQLDSTAEDRTKEQDPLETAVARLVGAEAAPAAVTLGFIALWYGLNVYFNLLNKSILQHFPFPYTVSVVHVAVGTAYCTLTYLLGLKSWSFGRAISPEELRKVLGPASMHAVGHIAANISYAAVAISLTHTVKTMEPAFNVLLSRLVLGEATPAPVVASLLPIMLGVALASSAELSFNWTGFLSAMVSNLTFGFRAVWGKAAMTKTLDSTAVYSYTTLISLIICLPVALAMEGESLTAGAQAAVSVRGEAQFYTDLVVVGICYHLYNLLSFNTLQRVSPVSHGVTNVVKRVVIIFSSVIVFDQELTAPALVGTVIALGGTWMYTEAAARHTSRKLPKQAPAAAKKGKVRAA